MCELLLSDMTDKWGHRLTPRIYSGVDYFEVGYLVGAV